MVYLDYAATTPYNKDVLKTYTQLLEKYFYNKIFLPYEIIENMIITNNVN